MIEVYKGLIGRTIKDVVKDSEEDSYDTFYGLLLDDGTIAWIQRDPEGNGPGFLQINDPLEITHD